MDDLGVPLFWETPYVYIPGARVLRLNSFEVSQNSLTFYAGHVCFLPGTVRRPSGVGQCHFFGDSLLVLSRE